MRKTKYLNKTFGRWTCTYVGIARVQGARTKRRDSETRKLIKSKTPGKRSYYYIFERPTSDGKANKIIRLSCNEAAKLYNNSLDIEAIAETRLVQASTDFQNKVIYQFIKPEH